MKEKVTCRVIFKMTPVRPKHDELESECIAFLLDVDASPGWIMSYMHVGQHGEASIGFFNDCKLATPEQYADLMWELDDIGYDVALRYRYIK